MAKWNKKHATPLRPTDKQRAPYLGGTSEAAAGVRSGAPPAPTRIDACMVKARVRMRMCLSRACCPGTRWFITNCTHGHLELHIPQLSAAGPLHTMTEKRSLSKANAVRQPGKEALFRRRYADWQCRGPKMADADTRRTIAQNCRVEGWHDSAYLL
mmetsp:Transcript_6563/g.15187  ORF Transcript_6563/g.15187 Transcript_6563/m.15187 type:complete len:156 (+) Transcript_6563:774-1241(+)